MKIVCTSHEIAELLYKCGECCANDECNNCALSYACNSDYRNLHSMLYVDSGRGYVKKFVREDDDQK